SERRTQPGRESRCPSTPCRTGSAAPACKDARESPSDLFRLCASLEASLQPANAKQIVHAHQQASEIGVLRAAMGARTVIHVDEAHIIALAEHQRDDEAMDVIEIGEGEERVATE